MKRKLIIMIPLLIMLVVMSGCDHESNIQELKTVKFPYSSMDVVVDTIPKGNFPSWIISKIQEWNGSVWIYQGKWKNRNVFFFYSPLMSTMFYNVYDPEGNRLEVKDPISFIDESSQWKCIYLPALADMLSASIE